MTPQDLYLKGKNKENIPFHPMYDKPITNPCYYLLYPEIKKQKEKPDSRSG